jgi:ferredoxin
MKVTIDRNICDAALNACEHCFSIFAQNPQGVDRYCIVEQLDDGSEVLTLTLRTDGVEKSLVLDHAQRQMVATEGWASLVDFIPNFYRA